MSIDSSESGLAKLIIAGAHRVGKSSLKVMLATLRPDLFEVAEKYKLRDEGAWASDLIDPDLRQMREEEYQESLSQNLLRRLNRDNIYVDQNIYQQLLNQGEIAFSYRNWDTTYAPGASDAHRTDRHMMYISDTIRGVNAYYQHFVHPLISVLLRADPRVIRQRLEAAWKGPDEIPMQTVRQRLHFFESEQSLFLQNANQFYFLLRTRSDEPRYPGHGPEEIEALSQSQIKQNAERVIDWTNIFNRFYNPGMSVQQFHEAANIDYNLRRLLGKGLDDVRVASKRGPIRLDLSDEFSAYKQEHQELPRGLAASIRELVVSYEPAHGRHNLLVYRMADKPLGVSDPQQEMMHHPRDAIDEIIKGFIMQRLAIGHPTERFRGDVAIYKVHGAPRNNRIDEGLISVLSADVRNALSISLGDTLPNVPDHTVLNIVFAYPTNGKLPRALPYSQNDINSLLPFYMQERNDNNNIQAATGTRY